jgi:hypothetical protein
MTPAQKEKTRVRAELQEKRIISRKNEVRKLMETVFNQDYSVHNGPFIGMNYLTESSGSALLPKLLGSYEEPIHSWVEEIIHSKKITKILDIGCAEGYYACGFALKMPHIEILAYDIDPEARMKTQELLALNGVKNVTVKSTCSHQELQETVDQNTLVFCDIEGHEQELLDPVNVPNLEKADLLIESHDWIIPGLTEELIRRFSRTHTIQLVVDYPFRTGSYQTPASVNPEQYQFITDERRPPGMKFMYLKSIHA